MSKSQDRVRNGEDFATLFELLRPGLSSREQVKFFDGRADYRSIARWKSGKEWPADWAVAKLQAEFVVWKARLDTLKAKLQSGPGRRGNLANLKGRRQPPHPLEGRQLFG